MKTAPLPLLFRSLSLTLVFATGLEAQPAASPYLWSHFAGTLGGPGRADGTGPAARFLSPGGVALDAAGNAYVADSGNHTIRKITPGGMVTTLAGTPGVSGHADGTGPDAQFQSPTSVAVDSAGTIYVADGRDQTIRQITAAGVVTTLAGTPGFTGNADGTGPAAQFNYPTGVAVDAAGNVYVVDAYNHSLRKITPAGVVTTLAGNSAQSGHVDGTGTAAQFIFGYPRFAPTGLTIDHSGNLYVADTEVVPTSVMIGAYTETGYYIFNSVVRKITPDGIVTTLTETAGSFDDTGTSAPAPFSAYESVALDGAGNLFMVAAEYAGTGNGAVRKVAPGGAATIVPGTTGITGASLAVDSAGAIIVTNSRTSTVLKILPDGTVTTLAGLAAIPGQTDGTGAAARFHYPSALAADRADNLYITDSDNTIIRKITPAGVVSTVSVATGLDAIPLGSFAHSVAVDRTGTLYVAFESSQEVIRKITPDGVATTVLPAFSSLALEVSGLAVDDAGNLYFTDSFLNTVNKVSPAGDASVLAGASSTPLSAGSADGPGALARFNRPRGLALDPAGNLYVADSGNATIRKITPTGVVSTLAGTAGVLGHVDGSGPAAKFGYETLGGLVLDRAGNLYATEGTSIRRITPDGVVTTIGGATGANGDASDAIGSEDGIGRAALFNGATGLAIDRNGKLFVTDSGNHSIREGQPAGPPVIAAQPQSQTVAPGGSASFSVTAGAVPDPTYQWYFGGKAFSGATDSTLILANARSADAGDYTVVVTNSLGSVTSSKATLTVSSPPAAAPSAPAAGGGSTGVWFACALLTLAATRARGIGRNRVAGFGRRMVVQV